VADPKILKRGGGRQFISSVLIYHKCATTKYMLFLHGKAAFWKKIRANGGRAPPLPPSLNPPLIYTNQALYYRLVLNILCVTYFVTSWTMSDPQSSDTSQIR